MRQNSQIGTGTAPPPTYTTAGDEDEFSEESDSDSVERREGVSDVFANHDPFSHIKLSISTPLHISGKGNHVAVDPGEIGGAVAKKVVVALREAFCGGGIPMIDEHGRPRPIKIHVAAGVQIQGEGNVVGEGAVEGHIQAASIVMNGKVEESEEEKEGLAAGVSSYQTQVLARRDAPIDAVKASQCSLKKRPRMG